MQGNVLDVSSEGSNEWMNEWISYYQGGEERDGEGARDETQSYDSAHQMTSWFLCPDHLSSTWSQRIKTATRDHVACQKPTSAKYKTQPASASARLAPQKLLRARICWMCRSRFRVLAWHFVFGTRRMAEWKFLASFLRKLCMYVCNSVTVDAYMYACLHVVKYMQLCYICICMQRQRETAQRQTESER